MRVFDWSEEKNNWLKLHRNIGFQDIVFCVENGLILDDAAHPNQKKYPGQRLLVVDIGGYAFLVPYVETDEAFFLKTIIPSRKATKQFLGQTT